MEIVNGKIDRYLDALQPAPDPLLRELEEWARAHDFPAVGPQVGRLLELCARMIGAKTILELGSGFGYSGLWFSRALPPDGRIILSDFSAANRASAAANFKRAGLAHLMEFHSGEALALLAALPGPFDIIFNDIDKELYPQVIEPAHARLRPGGLFITDNTLWDGKVTGKNLDPTTAAVIEFNTRIAAHAGFVSTIVPVRDGVTVALKI
jgi:caffeoyl-CoA O-methyltransferase